MRARTRPDDRVAEAAQRRLEALVAELGGSPPVRREESEQDTDGTTDLGVEDESDDQRAEEEEVLGRHARRPLPSSRRAASWAGDRLPPSVARLRLSGRHLAAVGMLLLIGVVLAGWSYLQA